VGPEPRGVAVTGRDGVDVTFWPLAYTDPETARHDLGRSDIRTHEAVLQAQLERVRELSGGDARSVVVAHAFVTGAQPSESERPLSVGGSGEVTRDVFEGFDYVALGHLHRPQRVGERVRYAGSLLKYSFDEADHSKSVTVVDVDAAGSVTLQERHLPVRRDLVRLRGSFDEVRERPDAGEYADAYVEVVLTDTDAVLDPMQKLRAVYPNILSLRREAWLAETHARESLDVGAMSTRDLFAEFFREATDQELSEAQQDEVDGALTAAGREEREVVA
jgi:DNA repair protein SbcD/Mre11